jgi:hypothetical protein
MRMYFDIVDKDLIPHVHQRVSMVGRSSASWPYNWVSYEEWSTSGLPTYNLLYDQSWRSRGLPVRLIFGSSPQSLIEASVGVLLCVDDGTGIQQQELVDRRTMVVVEHYVTEQPHKIRF